MPNWCSNDIVIKGPVSLVNRVITEYFDERGLSFRKVLPPPKDSWLDENKEYNDHGYNWAINTWDTKWPACDWRTTKEREYKNGKKELRATFDTAWSPPISVLVALSAKNSGITISLKFYERGCGFKGGVVIEDGEIINEWSDNYSGPRGG